MPRPPDDAPHQDLPEDDLANARTTETHVAVAPLSTMRDRPTLTLLSGVDAGKLFALDAPETIIGRARDAGVRIDDVGISRQHARLIRRHDRTFIIEDMGSTNGVFVNGERTLNIDLLPGDQVQIGPNVTLRFSLVDSSEETLARQLFDSSTRDALTRAFNRKYLMGRLVAEVAYAERHKAKMGLILFDLDHFKQTNDTYGHVAGDAVLHSVAGLVSRLIRTEDVFARYGGEEFVVLVRGIPHENVARFAERIRHGIEELAVPWETQTLTARVSLGVASLAEDGAQPISKRGASATGEALLELADARLYKAKAAGRNRVVAQ
jgi:diguanylate cyclase (GGDEF)-like protein